MEEQTRVLIVPTPGASREEDMAQRDKAAATAISTLLAAGTPVTVQLHANLDEEEIRRAVNRWKGLDVTFVLAEDDSSAQERERFVMRWKAAGGRGFSAGGRI